MQQAKAADSNNDFGNMLCYLVKEVGIGDERVLEMPYLRGLAFFEYEEQKRKDAKRTETFK